MKQQGELGLLRNELAVLRPRVPTLKRPFTFQKYNDKKKEYEWVTEIDHVSLRQFGASKKIEQRAYDIGIEITKIKQAILEENLRRERINDMSKGRKALMQYV